MIISIWHKFFKPPYGGGNQFLLALKNQLIKMGHNIEENNQSGETSIINALTFNLEDFKRAYKIKKTRIVHRIDGPMFLIRGFDKEKDDLCMKLNNEIADSTVLQSLWNYKKLTELGYHINNPIIIYNAVDPQIFNRKDKHVFSNDRKIKIVSSSWSSNPRKGKDIYVWMDNNLDFNRFEYVFVGNVDAKFKNITVIPATGSVNLSRILKQNDIYITASKNDPCSNALIEALSCGLPSLYFNDGGHPELVREGGLGFNEVDEIKEKLEMIVNNYNKFQDLIDVDNIDEVAEQYLEELTP